MASFASYPNSCTHQVATGDCILTFVYIFMIYLLIYFLESCATFLQSMTMIREVGDVLDLKRALDVGNQNCGAVMQEMKTVIKIWRFRASS